MRRKEGRDDEGRDSNSSSPFFLSPFPFSLSFSFHPTQSYNPTMALASNHIMYIGAPGVAAGSAEIFVVHCSFPFLSLLLRSFETDRDLVVLGGSMGG